MLLPQSVCSVLLGRFAGHSPGRSGLPSAEVARSKEMEKAGLSYL
jgi:hypothetical protein